MELHHQPKATTDDAVISGRRLRMGRVRVAGFAVSLDGFGAGPEQTLQDPLGKRGTELHGWFFGTKTFKAMVGKGGGSEGVDETFAPGLFNALECGGG